MWRWDLEQGGCDVVAVAGAPVSANLGQIELRGLRRSASGLLTGMDPPMTLSLVLFVYCS